MSAELVGNVVKHIFSGQEVETEEGIIELSPNEAMFMFCDELMARQCDRTYNQFMKELPVILSCLQSSNSAKAMGKKGGSAFAEGAAELSPGIEHQSMMKGVKSIFSGLSLGGGKGKGGSGLDLGFVGDLIPMVGQLKEAGIMDMIGGGNNEPYPGSPEQNKPAVKKQYAIGGKLGGN